MANPAYPSCCKCVCAEEHAAEWVSLKSDDLLVAPSRREARLHLDTDGRLAFVTFFGFSPEEVPQRDLPWSGSGVGFLSFGDDVSVEIVPAPSDEPMRKFVP